MCPNRPKCADNVTFGAGHKKTAAGNSRPMTSQPIGRTLTGQAQPAAAAWAAETPDPVLRGLARLAARVCGSPVASIAILGLDEAWCTPSAELPPAAVPRLNPFTYCTSQAERVFEVPDTAHDERFRESEMVAGTLAVRSYA